MTSCGNVKVEGGIPGKTPPVTEQRSMEPTPGLRVVRGPDWEWEDQDGGEGYVGTVAELSNGAVVVQWDTGQRCRYRCGEEGKYDLRILDSGPSGMHVSSVPCEWCQQERICGMVWRCVQCLDYHLCGQCYMSGSHSVRHQFFRLHHSDPKKRLRMAARFKSERLTARGIFPGAQVIRGVDWRWGDQDGGMSGYVLSIKGWQSETTGSVAQVQWAGSGRKNVYRVGHKGKVDLKCTTHAEGGWYYPEHLPILGAPVVYEDDTSDEFAAGDTVRVDLDLEIVKLMQEGHGGWNDSMADQVRDFGWISRIAEDGDVQVRYHNNSVYTFNTQVLTKVDIPFHIQGDVVRVIDDMATVHDLQVVGPGWVDDMALTVGQVGRVTKRLPSGQVQASVNGKRWLYHPRCLQLTSREELPNNPDEEDVDLNARMKVLTIVQHCDPRDAIIYTATAGDVASLRKHLEEQPQEVNWRFHGKTAVHVACTESYVGCLKLLMTYQPDLELEDDNGLRPIHVCAYSNFAEGAKILLEHGADINSKDGRQNTATMAAGALGHYDVLKTLLDHHLLNLHAGDAIGSTAIHCAVIARRDTAVKLLLEAGADPSIPNYTAATPLHDAVRLECLPSVEMMIMHYPEHISLQKADNGNTPLHVAAACNQLDMIDFLASQRNCNLSLGNHVGLTPLHIAAHEGHTAAVELLVGYGADLNAQVEDGNTALHLIMALQKMQPLSQNTPHLLKIEEALLAGYNGFQFEPHMVVMCMLVQEGADPTLKNRNGQSPLLACTPDIAIVLRTFSQKRGDYHGSLRSEAVQDSLPKALKKKKTVPPEAAMLAASFSKDLKKDVPKHSESATDVKGPEPPTSPGPEESTQREVTDSGKPQVSDAPSSLTEEDNLCCMCENEVSVRLSPCGHAVMCSDCASQAKRCPQCRERIVQRASLLTE